MSIAKLLMALLAFGLLSSPVPGLAKVLTVENIPRSISKDVHFGETLREVRIEGNYYTREWIIQRAVVTRGNTKTIVRRTGQGPSNCQ